MPDIDGLPPRQAVLRQMRPDVYVRSRHEASCSLKACGIYVRIWYFDNIYATCLSVIIVNEQLLVANWGTPPWWRSNLLLVKSGLVVLISSKDRQY